MVSVAKIRLINAYFFVQIRRMVVPFDEFERKIGAIRWICSSLFHSHTASY